MRESSNPVFRSLPRHNRSPLHSSRSMPPLRSQLQLFCLKLREPRHLLPSPRRIQLPRHPIFILDELLDIFSLIQKEFLMNLMMFRIFLN